MKVALYHPWIYVKSGLERTILEIRRRSRHEWTIYTNHYDADATYPELRSMGVVELDRVPVERSYAAVLKAAGTIFRTRLPLSDHDALLVCCDGLGSFVTFRNRSVPVVCLCFTPLRAVYDAEYKKRHLARYGAVRPLLGLVELVYRALDRLAWRNYRHAFCITENVKRRVLDGGLFPPDKIEIAYAGIAGEKVQASEIVEPFFFLPGRIMWTKNIELGIEAFRELRRSPGADVEMVVAGMLDRKSEPYVARLRELARGLPVRFETNLSDERMAYLYRRCVAVLFTSFNEDQGLTPLEAGMHGKPVIAVNAGGPTETVRHGVTGYLVPPEAGRFRDAMRAFLDDPAEARRMGREGALHCRRFTWEAFVDRIDNYLDTLPARRAA